MSLDKTQLMNTYINNLSKKSAICYMEECIKNRKKCHVMTLNVDQVVRIEKDPYFKQICDDAGLMVVDGHPLLWIARLYRKPIKEKICGSDLVPELCELASKKRYSVFLLGAAPGIAQMAADKLVSKYHDLMIAGVYSPSIGFEKNPEEIKKINYILKKSNADMLFVGLGVPKQDIFIYENMDEYDIPLSFSIGATIDFIAGKQKRAPKWINKIGMEWFYRLINDPKRMFKRYIIDDMKIFKLAIKYR